jgi:NAD(P)-dependent dehydrogenase (short-subunit alcohol dehydrogenase family)
MTDGIEMQERPVVAIVGGSSGIGRAIARRFAREGWRVALAAIDAEGTTREVDHLEGNGHLPVVMDVSRPQDCGRLRDQVKARYGAIQVLVNSAGISESHSVLATDFHAWNRQLEVMLYGGVHLCRAMVPILHDGARILQVTSIHHERVICGSSAYGMAKAAMTQWIRSLAVELAPRGILANCIAPGFVRTPMSIKQDGVNELETDWFRDNYIRYGHLPLKRAARPEEIAGVAWFLAGPDATYITGSVITVDGGLSITF